MLSMAVKVVLQHATRRVTINMPKRFAEDTRVLPVDMQ